MRISLLMIIFLACGQMMIAQTEYFSEQKPEPTKWEMPRLSFAYLPSHYVSQFPGHLFEVQGRLNEESALVLRAGPVIENGNLNDIDQPYFQNRAGFKSSVTYKVSMKSKKKLRPFIGVELFYNDFNFDRTRTFELSCGGGCQYFQEATYDMFINEYGLRIQNGLNIPISKVFYFEFAVAFGVKHQDIRPGAGRPIDPIVEFGEPFEDERTATVLAADLSIKIGFNILK